MYLPKKPFYHFSIDDSFDALLDLKNKNISFLEHPYFKFLYSLHTQYNVTFSLYLFYKKHTNNKWKTLTEVPNIKKWIVEKNKYWLTFGPHAEDFDTPPYNQSKIAQTKTFSDIYSQIDRFAGLESHAKFVRLHYYSESYFLSDFFAKKGVSYLFSTDREVGSHTMPSGVVQKLKTKGFAEYKHMNFLRTQFRVENFAAEKFTGKEITRLFSESLKKYGFVIFFTHEYELAKKDVREYLTRTLDCLEKLSIPQLQHI